jgi:hypothetical protein
MTTLSSSFRSFIGGAWVRRWIMAPLLVMTLVLGVLAGAPKPAYANNYNGDVPIITQIVEDIKKAIEQIEWLKTIFEWTKKIWSLLDEMLDTIDNSINAVGKVINAGQEALLSGEAEIADALSDNNTKDMMTASLTPSVIAHTPPPSDEDKLHHCLSIIANRSGLLYQEHINSMASGLTKAWVLYGRGQGMNLLGEQYDTDDYNTRCGKNMSGDPVTVHPVQGSTDCVGSGDLDTGHGDGDINIGMWEGMAMVVPQMSSTTGPGGVSATIPKATNELERTWIAARNSVYEAAGRHPSPPWGKQITSAIGRRRTANWNHCMAPASGFVHQMFEHMLYYSRFNQNDAPELYASSKAKCEMIRDQIFGGTLPDKYNNCTYGLSEAEDDYLTLYMCAGPKRAVAAAGAGATFPEIMKASDQCGARITAWKTNVAERRAAMQNAMAGLTQLEPCWAGTEGVGPTTKSSSTSSADDVDELDAVPPAKKASAHHGPSSRRSGTASLPRTVEQ